jgi:peptidoglycan/xylan/chitin deacetylase (PgdA/CDA1 family)
MKVLLLRGLNLFAKLYNRTLCVLFGRKGNVLVFHEVSQVFENDQSCKIRVDTFKRIIERAAKHYQIVSVDEFLKKGLNKAAVITFDDVPLSFYKEAYPILKEKQMPFTLFISNKFVGEQGYLSEKEILVLAQDPLCTIGAHTCNHVRLRNESGSKLDIKESKNYLERLLGKPVDFLAYPYGRYDSVSVKNRQEAKNAGFKAAFSTIPTLVPFRFNKFFIPRVELIK